MELLGGRRLEPYRPAQDKLAGVRGFLLFTCIFLVFVNPTLMVYAYLGLSKILELRDINLFNVLGLGQDAAVTAVGLVSGILTWSKKRAGVLLAKIFFFLKGTLSLLLIAVHFLLFYSGNYPEGESFNSRMNGLFAMGIILPTVFLIYLFRSVRVKNTYPKSAPAGEETAVAGHPPQ